MVDDEDVGGDFGRFEAEAEVFYAVDDAGEVGVLDVGGLGVVVGDGEGVDGEVVLAGEAGLVDDGAVEAGGEAGGDESHGDIEVVGGVVFGPVDFALGELSDVGRILGADLMLGEFGAVLGDDEIVDGAGLDFGVGFEVEGFGEGHADHGALGGGVHLVPGVEVLGSDFGLEVVGFGVDPGGLTL